MAPATAATTAAPTSAAPLRWGFLGCGKIANDFANAMKNLSADDATFTACAARSQAGADAFAKTHGFARAYGSYEALCADAEVDVVYIATVHLVHMEHISLALQHGKHVLVEKPMTMNAAQTAKVIALAREKKLFLMEGMWTRFFPGIKFVRQLVADKYIGDIHHVHAEQGGARVNAENEAEWSSASGCGVLVDSGIYPLAALTMILGTQPDTITASGKLSSGGADLYGAATLEYSGQRFGTFNYSCVGPLSNSVVITGTQGKIHIPSPFHVAPKICVTRFLEDGSEDVQTSLFPLPMPSPKATTGFNYPGSQGFLHEAKAVTDAIRVGKLECDEYPLDETLNIAKIMDRIRQAVGIVYAAD